MNLNSRKTLSIVLILTIISALVGPIAMATNSGNTLIANGEFDLKVTQNRLEISFDLNEEIDLSEENANITIEYLPSTTYIKSKLWAGYINSFDNPLTGEGRVSYGAGAVNDVRYLDVIPAGTRLYTSTSTGASINVMEVEAVRVTVIRADGTGETLTIYKDGRPDDVTEVTAAETAALNVAKAKKIAEIVTNLNEIDYTAESWMAYMIAIETDKYAINSKTRLVDVTGYKLTADVKSLTDKPVLPLIDELEFDLKVTQNRLEISFDLNEELELSKRNSNIIIEYLPTTYVKNKLWAGYINSFDNPLTGEGRVMYSTGFVNNKNYLDVIPAGTRLYSSTSTGASIDVANVEAVKVTVIREDGTGLALTVDKNGKITNKEEVEMKQEVPLIEKLEFDLKTTQNRLEISFDLNEELDLSEELSNIIIEYLPTTYVKNKLWAGYINSFDNPLTGEGRVMYSSGFANNPLYSDVIPAETRLYSSTTTGASIDVTNVEEVRVTVIRADGTGLALTVDKDGKTTNVEEIDLNKVVPLIDELEFDLKVTQNRLEISFDLNEKIDLSKRNSNIIIEYLPTTYVKNKLWAGYINSFEDPLQGTGRVMYSTGFVNNTNYSDVIPAGVRLYSSTTTGASIDVAEVEAVKVTVIREDGTGLALTVDKNGEITNKEEVEMKQEVPLIEKLEFDLKTTQNRLEISFDLNEEIDLSEELSNIIIEYLPTTYVKNKLWAGYINSFDNPLTGEGRVMYSSGFANNALYSDVIPAGTRLYTSTTTGVSIDVADVEEVRVTVIRADGTGLALTVDKNGKITNVEEVTPKAGYEITCDYLEINADDKELSNLDLTQNTVDYILDKIDTNLEIEVYNINNQPITGNSKVGTGTRILILGEDGTTILSEYIVIIYGDVTGTGEIMGSDAYTVLQFVAGMATPLPAQEKAGKVNKGDSIEASDAYTILQYVAGLRTSF